MTERKQVDWEGVERDYSAGLLSLREIANKYGTTEGGIRYKAKQKDWSRDLSQKIEQRTNEKLRKIELRTELRTEKAISEKVIIEANAQAIVNVKLKHRSSIGRLNGIVDGLFEEIEDLNKLKNLDNLPVRVDMTKKLMDTLKTSIDKERQAFDIQDKTSPIDTALSDLVKNVQKNSLFVVKNNQVEDLDDD